MRAPSRLLRSPLAALLLAVPAVARAQSTIQMRVGQTTWGAHNTTVTAPFFVANLRDIAVPLGAHIDMPKDWALLTGCSRFTLTGRESTMIVVGASIPARTLAGPYVVRMRVVDARTEQPLASDSMIVVVPKRRGVEVAFTERPRYVIAGKAYEAAVLVRNRGNVPATFRLTTTSSRGHALLRDSAVTLDASESRVVRVRMRAPEDIDEAIDDVIQLSAAYADTALSEIASARITVVPEPDRKLERYVRIPAQVRVRAASSDGVSPFEALGRGYVSERSNTQLDFLFRGPTGNYSAFGDRDEYRAELFSRSWRVRLGDHLFLLSPLTSSVQPGFGAGAEGTRGMFSVGGYGQQFRRQLQGGSESGAFVGAKLFEGARIAANFVDREGGLLPGRVGSARMVFERASFTAEGELARSQDSVGQGIARFVHIAGALPLLNYDLGHQYGDSAFAGSVRGAEHDYMVATAHVAPLLDIGLNGSRHRANLGSATGTPFLENLDLGNVLATVAGRFTLETGIVQRRATSQIVDEQATQHHVRGHFDQDVGIALLWGGVEVGRVRNDTLSGLQYTDATVGLRRTFSGASGGLWISKYTGGSITKGASGTDTYGGDVTMRVGHNTDLTAMAYATRVVQPNAEWHSQVDAQVSHLLSNGSTITLRARVLTGGVLPASQQNVAYLQYGMPMRLPVAPMRAAGRVYGRVVDQASGRGVPGALVRLGPQVAITDAQGGVAFGGVPAGEHRLSMTQETSAANTVFIGDPTVRIDSTKRTPTTFQLAVARGARVDVDVRRFAAVRTGVDSTAADSLVDAGALENIALLLTNGRDSVFETTGANGKALFTDIPPGAWTLVVTTDALGFQRFDIEQPYLTLAAGESRPVAVRLVPRKRDVHIIGAGEELRSKPQKPRNR